MEGLGDEEELEEEVQVPGEVASFFLQLLVKQIVQCSVLPSLNYLHFRAKLTKSLLS